MAALELNQIRKTYRNADNETLKGLTFKLSLANFLS